MVEPLEPRLLLSGTHYVVDTSLDVFANDGLVSLREAISAANTNSAVTTDVLAGSDTETDIITFSPSLAGKTITLTVSDLYIYDDLDIKGLGQDFLTIDANSIDRVFYIYGSTTVVDISAVTITGGFTANDGGGIYNALATLTLTDVTLSGNATDTIGGGIYNDVGTITMTNSHVDDNSSDTSGGITNTIVIIGENMDDYIGTLYLNNTVVANNSATLFANDLDGIVNARYSSFIGDADGDPMWQAVPDPEGNTHYTPLPDNPLVDAGNNDLLPADEFDLDGD